MNSEKLVGKIKGNKKVIEILPDGQVLCECVKCGSRAEFSYVSLMNQVHGERCRKCAGVARRQEVVGERFGEWTIVDRSSSPGRVKCRCSCGFEAERVLAVLKGNRGSCWSCYLKRRKKSVKNLNPRLYEIWRKLRLMELLDERWRDNAECFIAEVKESPVRGARLVRLDETKLFGVSNFYWKSQPKGTKLYEIDGVRHTMHEWMKITGLSKQGIHFRVRSQKRKEGLGKLTNQNRKLRRKSRTARRKGIRTISSRMLWLEEKMREYFREFTGLGHDLLEIKKSLRGEDSDEIPESDIPDSEEMDAEE